MGPALALEFEIYYLFICRLRLSKSHVLVYNIFVIFIIFLFDNLSIYYFPIWHYAFLLQRRAFMSFYQVLDVVTGPNRRQCYLRKEISTWCQIRKFKFFSAKCERLICFSAKYIILPWTNSVELDNTDVRQIGWTNCAAVWRIKYDGMNPSSKNSMVPFDEMELMKRNGWSIVPRRQPRGGRLRSRRAI